jgi:hypothetical protein
MPIRMKILIATVALLGLLRTGTTLARTADVVHFQNVDTVKVFFETLPANTRCAYTFYRPDNLLIDPDLIADAFAYPSGIFLQEARPQDGELGLRPAQLHFAPSAEQRKIVIVVRGKPGANTVFKFTWDFLPNEGPARSGSSGTYHYSSGTGIASSILSIASGMPVDTHVFTVEERGENTDTVLMVLGQNDLPIAFDDDSGLAQMSWLHLHQACPAGSCSILVAKLTDHEQKPGPAAGPGPVTLIWDADVHKLFGDIDLDGLGKGLEIVLGTCDPNNPNRDTDGDGAPDCVDNDVDGDGIRDDLEVIGRGDLWFNQSTPTNTTKLHLYGADPLQKDLFVEADWMPECDGGPAEGCLPARKNQWQLDSNVAGRIASLMSSVANVHIDTGIDNPAKPHVSGNWGGAELLPDEWGNYCKGETPLRHANPRLFYHVMASDGGQNTGRCSRIPGGVDPTGSQPDVFAHETGHYYGLDHWGRSADRANCKPQYLSVMNYAYQNSINLLPSPFSNGSRSSLVLNPTRLDESAGIGVANSTGVLATLIRDVFGREVDGATGSVDWNLDGQPAGAGPTVRGVLNYAGENDCDRAPYWTRASLEFVKALRPTVAETDYGLVVLASKRADTGELTGQMYMGLPNLAGCAVPGPGGCAIMEGSTLVSLNPAPALLPACAAGNVVIYAAAGTGELFSYTFSVDQGAWFRGRFRARTPQRVGGASVTGAPIAFKDETSGRILVFAPGRPDFGSRARTLKRWEYDPATDTWPVIGSTEVWSDGTPILLSGLNAGIGVTNGRLSDDPPGQMGIFAAIPAASGTANVARIEIARLDRSVAGVVAGTTLYSEQWTKLDPGIWAPWGGARTVAVPGRVSIAFQPEGNEGRFYLTHMDTFRGNPVLRIAFTRGNVPWNGVGQVPVKALAFLSPAYFGNVYYPPYDGMSLVTYDGGIVGAADSPPCEIEPCEGHLDRYPWSTFFPNANGIYNVDQTDFDDLSYLRSRIGPRLLED